jgi:WhiB family redox-sensing transcriptional regulator
MAAARANVVFAGMAHMTPRHVDWTAAACRDQDPELFFPLGDGKFSKDQVARAKAICARCALVEQCRDWALESGIAEGVWGGYTEQERRSLRRLTRTAQS